MATFRDFRDLPAWQLAHEMNLRVDVFLGCPEFRRHFKFCEQLREAARSGPRCIAEGHAQLRPTEFAALVRAARGSEEQVLNHLIAAHNQALITSDELDINRWLTARAMEAASGLIRHLESTPERVTSETR